MWNTLRKFGFKYYDLPTMIWNVSILLRVLTLDIDKRNNRGIPKIFFVITIIVSASYFYVYLVSMVWFVFFRCAQTGDYLAGIIVFSLGVSSEISSIKLLFMILNKKNVKQLVSELLVFDSLVKSESLYSRNILKTLKHVKRRAIMFWLVIIMNGVVYLVKPILLPGRHLMEDQFILYGLEPMYETPNYQIAFFLMSCGVCFSVYLPANITAFLIVITGYIEAQILALSEELINIWPDAKNNYKVSIDFDTSDNLAINDKREKELNIYVNNNLKEIIQKHSRLITLFEKIENVFKGAIAVEFVILIVGLIAELLGGLENTYIQLPFALMQVSMDCFTGQRVMDASEVFYRAVYDCKWENFDKDNMKLVLLMLQCSQKTLTLSAGGVKMLSFSCFMSVIRNIYSAYTTLSTTMNH